MATVSATRTGGGVFGPIVTAKAIAGDVADFDCAGWSDCTEIYLSALTAITISGFFAVPGRRSLCRLIVNSGLCPITLTAEDAHSLEPNRLAGTSVVLASGACATLVYDYAALRWRIACHSGVLLASQAARSGARWSTDFLSGTNAIPELNFATGGGGTTARPARAGGIGVLRCSTDTATAGSYSAVQGATMFLLSQHASRLGCRLQIAQLQAASDHCAHRIGFLDANNTAPTDGAYWEYDTSQGANWRICTAASGNRSEVATGVPVVAGSWLLLEVAVNAGATSADFLMNGSLIGTITTNIPAGALESTSFGFHVARLTGTPSQQYGIFADSIGVDLDIAPGR